jgi:hypothetical protein
VSSSSHVIERADATFDDENLIANAGLALVGVLVLRLGLERLINGTVRLTGRVGGALPGRKLLTLVHTLMVGGTHIAHADALRAGATSDVLPHRVMAPSTVGTFLRSFTFGHLRQLDVVAGEALRRAWAMGAGPSDELVVFDIDSTITEVHGYQKQGASFGYTKVRGYHPLLATRAGTGEVVHARQRKGAANTGRGAKRFVEELIPRVRRAGATRKIIVRADSGFWSNKTITTLERLGVGYTIAVRSGHKAIRTVIATIDETAWVDSSTPTAARRRLPTSPTRAADWSCAAPASWAARRSCSTPGVTTRSSRTRPSTSSTSTRSTAHTPPSNSPSRTSKRAPGRSTCRLVTSAPTAPGSPPQCWPTICSAGCIVLGGIGEANRLVVARTILVRLLAIPARLVHPAGRPTLRMPARWPWATTFTTALDSLRALPTAPL